MKKLLALLTAAVATLTSAWAAEPLAVWNGFTNLTGAEGYTLTAGEGVVDTDGVATIADGQILRLDKNLGTAFTVVMEVEDIPGTSSGFTTLIDWRYADNSSHLSVDTKDSRLRHIWNNGDNVSWGQSALFKTPIGRSVVAIAYSYANRGEKTYVNGVEVVSGGAYSQNAVARLGIGGYVNDTPTQCAVGMKVYRLALYNGQLSADEVAEVSKVEPAYGKSYTWSNLASKANKTWYYTRASGAFSVNIPATADVPAGTVVAISKLKFGTKASGNNWSSSMTLNGVTSSAVTMEDNEYDETYNKLKVYTFDTPALVEVGKEYAVTTAGSSSQFTAVMCASPVDIKIGNSGCTYCAVEGAVLHEASVGDVKYNTVAAAIAAASETETTITLMSDGVGAIELPANITLDVNGKTLSGAVTGTGKIKFSGMPTDAVADACAFTAAAWKGTVEIGAITENGGGSTQFKLEKLGNAGSTILWNGDFGTKGKYLTGGANNKIAAKVVLAGDLLFNNGSSGANYFFGEIDGNNTANNISFLTWRQNDGVGASYHVDKLSHFKGTITATRYTTISELALDEMPAADEKILSFGTPNGSYHTSAASFAITQITVGGEPVSLAYEIVEDDGVYVRKAASVGETDYATLNEAFENAGANGTIKLLCDISSSVTIPAGKHIDVNGHSITGSITFGEGAYLIEDGHPMISGFATSFDATFNDPANPTVFKFKEEAGVSLQYDSTATFVNEDPISKDTGITLKSHPYFNNIPASWFNNTAELTLAVVGTMTEATRTTFIHMGRSNDNGYGLLLATGDKKDEVIVAWNHGGTVTEITRMNVANAALSRHVYIVTKKDVDTKTTFTVYLDGMKWKTLVVDRFTIVGGVQVGSDFGGQIYRYSTGKDLFHNVTEDVGLINAIRLYDRVISPAEIAQYSASTEYPYVSPNGSSTRTFAEDGNWIEEAKTWSNTAAGETEPVVETAPGSGSVIATISVPATITVNLTEDATCEALTLQGEEVSFVASGTGAIIPTAATISAPVTLVPEALDLSKANTTIVGDGKIIADYSDYDVKSIYSETTVFVTGEIDQQAEGIVTATLPTHTYRTIGELAYNTTTHQYGFTVTPVMVDVEIPTIANTTVSVAAGTLNCTITEGVASVPGGADITITYAPVAGYHFTAEMPVASVTASDVTAETQIDVAGVTAVEINMYTVKVMQVENAIATVTIGEGTPAVVTDDTVQVPHGSTFRVDYAATEGYKLVAIEGDESGLVTENYHYGQVTQNMGDYTLHFEVVPAAPAAPTVLVTPTTVDGLHAAYTYTFGELTQEQKDYYGDWTADYIVSFNKAIAADTVVLSGQYDGNGEEWVNLTLGAKSENEEFGLIAAALEQTGWTGVTVNFTFLLENVGTFNCGIKNLSKDNEDTEMTVKLVLSKDGETKVIGDEEGVKYKIDATAVQGPTSWEETTPSEVIELPEGATTTVTATEIAAWAEKNGVAFEAGITIPVNALIFNCAPNAEILNDVKAAADDILEEYIEEATKEIDLAALLKEIPTDGKEISVEGYPMATIKLVPATLGEEVQTSANLFKLSIELKK